MAWQGCKWSESRWKLTITDCKSNFVCKCRFTIFAVIVIDAAELPEKSLLCNTTKKDLIYRKLAKKVAIAANIGFWVHRILFVIKYPPAPPPLYDNFGFVDGFCFNKFWRTLKSCSFSEKLVLLGLQCHFTGIVALFWTLLDINLPPPTPWP